MAKGQREGEGLRTDQNHPEPSVRPHPPHTRKVKCPDATETKTIRARTLRRDQTDAERKLWSMLRNRQLGGRKFRRQVPIDRYFADFACVEAKLVG